MTQLIINLRLLIATAVQHLADDPVVLFLQLSRRLPASWVQPLAKMVLSAAPAASPALPPLLAALARGDDEELQRRLQYAAERGFTGTRARNLAEVALAGNHPSWADGFITAAAGAKGLASTRARRFWYDGALSEAVAVLDLAGSSRRQRNRNASELRILQGWQPQLAPVAFRPEPRRVLHLLTNSLPHTGSGYAQRSHSILLAQKEAGWDVRGVTRLGYPVQVGKPLARGADVVDGIRYERLMPSMMAPLADARLQQQAEELLQVAREYRPSILHTTTPYTNGLVTRAVAESLGIPWVYEVRGQLADTWASTRGSEAFDSERYRLTKDREAEIMLSADLVVTLGRSMKGNILAAGIPPTKIILAPNAIGGDYLRVPMNQRSARKLLGLPEKGLYIGTVSSLVPYEGIEDLVEAFKLLAPGSPDLRLLIVGAGTALPGLQRRAQAAGLGDRVMFTGRVPRTDAWLYHQALDIFVVPRKDLDVTRDVTPLKPVEALACARPVVASDLPALSEIIDDGVTGILVPPEHPEALANRLAMLLGNVQTRQSMGDLGRENVLRTRTWAANAVSYSNAYAKVRGTGYS